ncbi:MAG: DUF3560 domain-containing protein [Anaerolineales bacterium]
MNHYEAKLEARRERLLARADKLRGEASRRFSAARAATDGIPLGQPILVGHHSEGRHRAALKCSDQNMRAGVAAQKASSEADRRADGVGTAGISSDDPDATSKLGVRIAALEKKQEQMVAVNKLVKKGDRAGLAAMGAALECEPLKTEGVRPAVFTQLEAFDPFDRENEDICLEQVPCDSEAGSAIERATEELGYRKALATVQKMLVEEIGKAKGQPERIDAL